MLLWSFPASAVYPSDPSTAITDNFSYQFLNEQNNEIEKLQEAVDALREDEAKYSEDNDNVNQHQALVKEIEGKLFRVESQASNFEVCLPWSHTVAVHYVVLTGNVP